MSFQDVNTRRGRLAAIGLLTALAAVPLAPLCADPLPPSGPPVATGLDNPKGLRFGLDGSLYIAEAGHGGSGACVISAEQQEVCFGATGAITQVKNGVQRRIVTGLPSLAGADGFAATGPHDVSALGNGILFVPIGLGNAPAATAPGSVLAGSGLGTLIRANGRSGHWTTVADLAAYEGANDPDGSGPDTNPFGALALPGRTFVVDSGANAILKVTPWGTSTFAVFADELVPAPDFLGLPPGAQIPMQAVPTAIARDPRGNLYVGRLTGFPFPVGGAQVVELTPAGEQVHSIDGFTNVVDLTFGPDGSLYVVEISQSSLLSGAMDGAVWKVDPAAASKDEAELIAEVQAPGGAAFGPDGNLYVTAGTVVPASAGGGVVLRFDLH